MDMTSLLPLASAPTQTPTPATLARPATALPTDFAALLAQASLTVPDAPAPVTTALPQPAPWLPPTQIMPHNAEPLAATEPADDDAMLPPETLALMASLPAIAPPPVQHDTPAPRPQSAPATPVITTTAPPAAPLTPAPTTPHATAELPATPVLADAVQRQAEQAEAPMISTPRDIVAAPAGTTPQTPVNTAPVTLTASLPAAMGSPQWPQDFSQQLVHISRGLRGGEQRVEMHLNPAHLGPLSVSLTLDDQSAQAQFFSVHAPVRAAVEQAIPQLREALAEQGISLGDAMVGEHRQPPGEQHASHSGQHRADHSSEPVRDALAEPALTPASAHGVDLYA